MNTATKVNRSTVELWKTDVNRAHAMYEQGVSYSFSPCQSYQDRNYNIDCDKVEGQLSENFRLVTVKVWRAEEKERDQVFAVHADEQYAPAEALESMGQYYSADGKNTLLENLYDADWCIHHKVITL